MKRFYLLIALIINCPVIFAQTHFQKVWTGNGVDQMSIFVFDAKLDGVDLVAGDEIALFGRPPRSSRTS